MTKKDEFKNVISGLGRFYIFGTSTVAHRLFLLINELGFGNSLEGFVVSEKKEDFFENMQVFSIDEVQEVNERTQSILVSVSETYHQGVYISLRKIFANVVSAIEFFSLELSDAVEVPKDCVNLEYELSDNMIIVRDKIIDKYFSTRHAFGEERFYQSFPLLGINGTRDTELRLEKYGLKSLLHKDDVVLDIGCNCGFLDMEIAEYVDSIYALEYDASMSEFSNYVKQHLNIDNIYFISADFKDWQKINKKMYSFIISSAVHIWIAMNPKDYSEVIYKMLLPGGKLLFESQDIKGDKEFDTFCEAFVKSGMAIEKEGHICDDGKIDRKFEIFKKYKD